MCVNYALLSDQELEIELHNIMSGCSILAPTESPETAATVIEAELLKRYFGVTK